MVFFSWKIKCSGVEVNNEACAVFWSCGKRGGGGGLLWGVIRKAKKERKKAIEQKVERRRVLCFVLAAIASVIFLRVVIHT